MNFDDYLQQVNQQDTLEIHPSWGQGRTTFGGLSAALILHRIEQGLDDGQVLRSLNVSFCGPLNTAEPFTLSSQSIRVGKSVAHYQGQTVQQDQVTTLVNACFGRERESDIEVKLPPVSCGTPGSGQAMPFIKGITPEFTQHINFTYVEGGLPFTNNKHNVIRGWMRFNDGERALSNAHLVALIDAWPPTLLQKLKSPAPCASVTWSIEMVTPLSQLPQLPGGSDWLWYEADIRQAHDGYGHTEARIYTADGVLLALSRQLVVVYDKR